MFHKFSKMHFHKTIGNLKNHIGRGYHHVKNVAGHIDYGFSIAKQIYHVLEPVIK